MKIKVLEKTPRKVLEFPLDNDLNLTEKEVEDVAEIFKTPLTGSYNWDYTIQDNRIKKHNEHGKQKNGYINYVKGANIAGFAKVADAMLAQGVI